MIKRKFVLIFTLAAIMVCGKIYTTNAPSQEENTEQVTEILTEDANNTGLDFGVSPSNDKYNSLNSGNTGWGFKKEKNAPPYIDKKTKEMFSEYNAFYIGNDTDKILYLTFDEGYENGYTGIILDCLKEKQVPAAFFITMPYLKNETELVDRMVNEGHVVGNHTVNHPNLAKISLSEVNTELKGLDDLFYEMYGIHMNFLRPPEGEYSEKMLAYVSDIGYKTALWSFAYRDWDIKNQKGAEYAFNQVTPYLHNGAVLLLHAVSSDNAAALPRIIDYAREQGYEFKSLNELT